MDIFQMLITENLYVKSSVHTATQQLHLKTCKFTALQKNPGDRQCWKGTVLYQVLSSHEQCYSQSFANLFHRSHIIITNLCYFLRHFHFVLPVFFFHLLPFIFPRTSIL